jgi:hypothetical protein
LISAATDSEEFLADGDSLGARSIHWRQEAKEEVVKRKGYDNHIRTTTEFSTSTTLSVLGIDG